MIERSGFLSFVCPSTDVTTIASTLLFGFVLAEFLCGNALGGQNG